MWGRRTRIRRHPQSGLGQVLVPTMPEKDSEHSVTAPPLPDRRTRPYRIAQWKYLWRDEFVELRRGSQTEGTGRIDETTADGRIMWIHLSAGGGRVMIHEDDGIDIWRVDPRICQNRPLT